MSAGQPEDLDVLTKEAVMADPLILSRCFQKHAGPHLTQGRNPAWVDAIKTAEAICDTVLQSMTVSELFGVYSRYLDQSPSESFPYKADGRIYDSLMRSDRDDYYSMDCANYSLLLLLIKMSNRICNIVRYCRDHSALKIGVFSI